MKVNAGDRVVIYEVDHSREDRFVGATGVAVGHKTGAEIVDATVWVKLDIPPDNDQLLAKHFSRPGCFLAWRDQVRVLTSLERLAEVAD